MIQTAAPQVGDPRAAVRFSQRHSVPMPLFPPRAATLYHARQTPHNRDNTRFIAPANTRLDRSRDNIFVVSQKKHIFAKLYVRII